MTAPRPTTIPGWLSLNCVTCDGTGVRWGGEVRVLDAVIAGVPSSPGREEDCPACDGSGRGSRVWIGDPAACPDDTTVVVSYASGATVSIGDGPPRAIGVVYVVDVGQVSPGAYSYTKDPGMATRWPARIARAVIDGKAWPDAHMVRADDAQVLR